MEPTQRDESDLDMRVPDSGRTWSVMYDEINFIPADSVQRGDVFIVRHKTQSGVMFMQATEPKPNGWVLEDVTPWPTS